MIAEPAAVEVRAQAYAKGEMKRINGEALADSQALRADMSREALDAVVDVIDTRLRDAIASAFRIGYAAAVADAGRGRR